MEILLWLIIFNKNSIKNNIKGLHSTVESSDMPDSILYKLQNAHFKADHF